MFLFSTFSYGICCSRPHWDAKAVPRGRYTSHTRWVGRAWCARLMSIIYSVPQQDTIFLPLKKNNTNTSPRQRSLNQWCGVGFAQVCNSGSDIFSFYLKIFVSAVSIFSTKYSQTIQLTTMTSALGLVLATSIFNLPLYLGQSVQEFVVW